MKDVTRSYGIELVVSQEERMKMVRMVLPPGMGVFVDFVVLEAEDGE